MSIAEEYESLVSLTHIVYNSYDFLASYFDGLMGTRTQLTLSVDTSDSLLQLSLSKHISPPDGITCYILGKRQQETILKS